MANSASPFGSTCFPCSPRGQSLRRSAADPKQSIWDEQLHPGSQRLYLALKHLDEKTSAPHQTSNFRRGTCKVRTAHGFGGFRRTEDIHELEARRKTHLSALAVRSRPDFGSRSIRSIAQQDDANDTSDLACAWPDTSFKREACQLFVEKRNTAKTQTQNNTPTLLAKSFNISGLDSSGT